MVYLFNEVHERYFGAGADYKDIKKSYNDLVLGMEDRLRNEIESSKDPLAKALIMARIGNYIDFGAMNHVDEDEFLSLFSDTDMREDDRATYESFLNECANGRSFLLVCDNCGEIVLDKLMLEQLKERFPHLTVSALVREKEVLNDATVEDAEYTGLDKIAEIISNGEAIAGTIYDMMLEDFSRYPHALQHQIRFRRQLPIQYSAHPFQTNRFSQSLHLFSYRHHVLLHFQP